VKVLRTMALASVGMNVSSVRAKMTRDALSLSAIPPCPPCRYNSTPGAPNPPFDGLFFEYTADGTVDGCFIESWSPPEPAFSGLASSNPVEYNSTCMQWQPNLVLIKGGTQLGCAWSQGWSQGTEVDGCFTETN
jgi:hypothetical protein